MSGLRISTPLLRAHCGSCIGPINEQCFFGLFGEGVFIAVLRSFCRLDKVGAYSLAFNSITAITRIFVG